MEEELWKEVPEFIGKYEVSNIGNVRRFYKDKRKSPRNKNPHLVKGYHYVILKDCGKIKQTSIHRLVLSVFDKNMPSNIHCCHKNNIKTDNRLSNLKWGTSKENEADKIRDDRHARGDRNGKSKMTNNIVFEIRKMFNSGMPVRKIAETLGLKQSNVWFISNNKTWKHLLNTEYLNK